MLADQMNGLLRALRNKEIEYGATIAVIVTGRRICLYAERESREAKAGGTADIVNDIRPG